MTVQMMEGRGESMREAWLKWVVELSCAQDDLFWSGARKVLFNRRFTFDTFDDSIGIGELGFTKSKIRILQTKYFHPESFGAAMYLHEHNVRRRKYSSASFHCYNHYLKSTYETRSSAGSVMGPCIQSVVLTLKPHEKRTAVDMFYRTTEALKKFPADLIWLNQNVFPLVPGQDKFPLVGVTIHFANITLHPMYLSVLLALCQDPIATLQLIRSRDPALWRHAGVWLSRYLIGGAASRSIESFAQSKRTADSAMTALAGKPLRDITNYLFEHRALFKPQRTRFDMEDIEQAFQDARSRVNGG
jgi:hypothetical protein